MKLSIIVPVYNSERYLAECLDSILSDKSNDFEVILVNDGSTDNSFKIIKKYKKNDSRIKLFEKENGGVSSARNLGIKKATGEYVMFVDSDDKLEENWHSIIENISNDDIYYFSSKINKDYSKKDILESFLGLDKVFIIKPAPFSKLFKRSFIVDSNTYFDDKIVHGEDLLFNIKALNIANSFKLINKTFYNYHIYPGNSSQSFDKKIFDSYIVLLEKLKEEGLEERYLVFETQQAVFTIFQKLSALEYKEAKKYYSFINEEPYKTALNRKLLINNKFKPFIRLAKSRQYCLVHNLLKSIRKRKVENEHFKKI